MDVKVTIRLLISPLLVFGLASSCSTQGRSDTDSSEAIVAVESTVEEALCDPATRRFQCNYADLSRQSLDGLILAGGSFRGADFSYASLRGTNFDGADLRSAKFNNADLTGANLSRTNILGSSFEYANLVGAKIQDVCLQQLNFDYSDLTLADFARSKGGVYMRAKDSNLNLSVNLDMIALGTESCK